MKKIRLHADDQEVLSFTTDQQPGVRGTVAAAGTGNPCYNTVGYHQTHCVGYPPSYWQEFTCGPLVPETEDINCTGHAQPNC